MLERPSCALSLSCCPIAHGSPSHHRSRRLPARLLPQDPTSKLRARHRARHSKTYLAQPCRSQSTAPATTAPRQAHSAGPSHGSSLLRQTLSSSGRGSWGLTLACSCASLTQPALAASRFFTAGGRYISKLISVVITISSSTSISVWVSRSRSSLSGDPSLDLPRPLQRQLCLQAPTKLPHRLKGECNNGDRDAVLDRAIRSRSG